MPRKSQVLLDGAPVGVTPYTDVLPKNGRRLVYLVHHDGFIDRRIDAIANDDVTQLAKLEPRPTPSARGSGGSGSGNGSAALRGNGSSDKPDKPDETGETGAINPRRHGH